MQDLKKIESRILSEELIEMKENIEENFEDEMPDDRIALQRGNLPSERTG